jgi:hypothetical protein
MSPEEMADCLPAEWRTRAAFGFPGDVQASWILEARAYPNLCQWLKTELNWMLDPDNPDQVAEAAARIKSDEMSAGGTPQFMADGNAHGLRHRLRKLPVCSTCFCLYNVTHAAISMVKFQHRDRWARREIRLRQEREKQVWYARADTVRPRLSLTSGSF